MGLVNIDGSYDTTIEPISNDFTATGDLTTDKLTTQQPYVKDSFINKNSINIDRYPEITTALLGYGEGSVINVLYFHNHNNQIGTATTSSDLVTRIDGVHQGWLQVNNFEFKLRGSLSFVYDPDSNQAECTGEGYIYPGFNPSVGDLFLYETDTNQTGRFKINKVERLTIKRNTCYSISFNLTDFVGQDEITALKNTVDEVVYFDRARYFANEKTLLYTSDYVLLKELTKLKTDMISKYCRKFYDYSYHTTFIRPDGVYDPYVLKFIQNFIGYNELGTYPNTLINKPVGEYNNIYSYLLDPSSTNLNEILNKYVVKIRTENLSNTTINSLINRPYLEVVSSDTGDTSIDDISIYYVLSEAFYTSNIENYTSLDRLIVDYINNKKIDPNKLLTLVRDYKTLPDELSFYQIPIYLFLILKLSVLVGK